MLRGSRDGTREGAAKSPTHPILGPVSGDVVRGPRRKRLRVWLNRTDWFLAAVAVLFLAAYAWPILDVGLGPNWRRLCSSVQFAAWVIFVVDYVARVLAARDRRKYFTKHILDLFIVALPALRPLRLLRLVVLFRVLNRKAAASLRGRVPLYVSVSAMTLVFCAALAVLDAERNAPGSNIKNFGDAIWWAIVTVTTVGYGDHFPVTVEGRFVAGGLMIGGVALIGVVTASFAAWFIDRVRDEEEEAQAATQRDLQQIAARLDVLSREMKALRAAAERAERRELTPP
ncbi:MAG: voltage-gated potassium channel [Pseudonocardiales bacterium]|nr:voltage-gated potassium channel [Pseudonocardiales bacterium]